MFFFKTRVPLESAAATGSESSRLYMVRIAAGEALRYRGLDENEQARVPK